ncbi:MAG: hypothetical protein SV686_00440 [Thermodesulfobacteriota bacterium]|nr:hypothetical protein [Thermodesulfobacteriota bacterium]
MRSRSKKRYVIELDGLWYRYEEGVLEQISDLMDITGDCLFVSDLDDAVSRTMTIEAPIKYVEVMVRKQLQETGEFDEPISIITHSKKRKEKNAADIFFTALPTKRYFRYLDRIKEHDDSLLLVPLYSVLFSVLKRMKTKQPAAVVFRHGRFADLVIGSPKRIHYANRCVAFDETEEQISSLWDMLQHDIQQTEIEERIQVNKVLLMNWIDSQETPIWSEESDMDVLSMEEEEISADGTTCAVSFINGIRMHSGLSSVSKIPEKISFYSRACLPYLNGILLIACVLFFLGYLWCDRKADFFEKECNKQSRFSVTPERTESLKIPYDETLAFIEELERYRSMPSFKELLNDFSVALESNITVDVFKADYSEKGIDIEIFAKTKASFDAAHRGYQRFLNEMKKKGYIPGKTRFDTTIQESRFLASFKKRPQ